MTYNGVLKDTDLSLQAKGLYILIQSYIGIPGIELFKRKLAQRCADSYYAFKSAWSELRNAGYLRHYSVRSSKGFSQAYDLIDVPTSSSKNDTWLLDDAAAQRVEQGLCRHIRRSGAGDFTAVPDDIVRDKDISLSVKALYALVAHLNSIPDYVLRVSGVMHFCKEKLKHFQTLWRKFKLSGLLKQHRHPCGQGVNKFSYRYDLLAKKSLHTPYLTNYHADGSVSTTITIQEYAQRLSDRMGRTSIGRLARSIAAKSGTLLDTAISRKKHRKSKPGKYPYISEPGSPQIIPHDHITPAQIQSVKNDIGYERFCLSNREHRALLDTIVAAVAEMRYLSQVKIGSTVYDQIDIAPYVDDIDDAVVMDLLDMVNAGRINLSQIKNLKGYLKATLLNMNRDLAVTFSNDI